MIDSHAGSSAGIFGLFVTSSPLRRSWRQRPAQHPRSRSWGGAPARDHNPWLWRYGTPPTARFGFYCGMRSTGASHTGAGWRSMRCGGSRTSPLPSQLAPPAAPYVSACSHPDDHARKPASGIMHFGCQYCGTYCFGGFAKFWAADGGFRGGQVLHKLWLGRAAVATTPWLYDCEATAGRDVPRLRQHQAVHF